MIVFRDKPHRQRYLFCLQGGYQARWETETMRNAFQLAVTLALFVVGATSASGGPPESVDVAKATFHAQGEKVGDPTQDSIILLTRLTAVEQRGSSG